MTLGHFLIYIFILFLHSHSASSFPSLPKPYPSSIPSIVSANTFILQSLAPFPPVAVTVSPTMHVPPMISGARRSGSHSGGLAQAGQMASSSEQSRGFYFFQSGGTLGRNFQDSENPLSTRFHGWEREHLSSFPLTQVGAFHPVGSGSDSSIRPSSFRQRHGSEMTSSQNGSYIHFHLSLFCFGEAN